MQQIAEEQLLSYTFVDANGEVFNASEGWEMEGTDASNQAVQSKIEELHEQYPTIEPGGDAAPRRTWVAVLIDRAKGLLLLIVFLLTP